MKKNMALKQLTSGGFNLLLFLNGTRTPTQEEWDAAMAHVINYARTGEMKRMRCLIISDGGGPDAGMRGQLMDYYKQHQHYFQTAVVTNSLVTRGIVAAINWFNPYIKAFSSRHFGDALAHLDLPRNTEARILREAQSLEHEVGSVSCLRLVPQASTSATL